MKYDLMIININIKPELQSLAMRGQVIITSGIPHQLSHAMPGPS